MGLIGGAIKKSIKTVDPNVNFLTLLFVGILVVLIKAYVVRVSYNHVAEKITGNKYKLTYMDAIFLVILFMGLI
jgi:hypothetical protein